MRLKKLAVGIIAFLAVAPVAYGQSVTGAIEQLPIRTLSHVIGHDGTGRVGREPVTDFVKPGSTSPTTGNLACWGTTGNLIADCGTPGSMAFQNSNAVSITGGSVPGDLNSTDAVTGISVLPAGGDQAHNNTQPTLILNKIIKV
ncbi:hypothetical protein [Rhizobium sp. 60-20]|uniref:hypothetical protein n=1 Tax=Rhizobium sp. 60-20 TaxID=1895819 RepID=UPI0009273A3A|nr:hypothetical protein [Rhizobium sp. 60-20]OJY66459.1 MAG: hypothetical protein BGP09_31535 [Rhizobium sp. 60-20]